jgi:hypothetical protein
VDGDADTTDTGTILNSNLDVVAEVEGIVGRWVEVVRFLNSSPRSLDGFGRSVVINEPADLNVGSLDLPKTGLCNEVTVATPDILPPPEERIRDFSKLNRSDWDELDRHGFLLSQRQQRHLKAVERKRELYPQKFRQHEYLQQSAILLLSPGWASAERYACCGIRNQINPSGACKLHKYCPYCCWWDRNERQLTYVPAFDNGSWHWFTGSFKGELEMDPATPMTSAEEWVHYCEAYKSALLNWVEEKGVRGVFWVEELAVNSLLPTRVLPHVHAIVEADQVEEAELEEFNDMLNGQLNALLGPDHLQPNITCEPINTARGLLDRIGYMLKPLNLLTAYEKAWPRASFHNRNSAQQLNSQVADLILGYSHLTTDRRKMNVKGSLDSKAKSFIGIPRAERKNHKNTLAEIKAEVRKEYIEMSREEAEEAPMYANCPENDPGTALVHALPTGHKTISQGHFPIQ